MLSYASTPSTLRTLSSGSVCVRKRTMCPTQSVPARVERANWNGEHAASISSPNCLASVLATTRRNEAPATMPRTPSSSFRKAVKEPRPQARATSTGNLARAYASAASWTSRRPSRRRLETSNESAAVHDYRLLRREPKDVVVQRALYCHRSLLLKLPESRILSRGQGSTDQFLSRLSHFPQGHAILCCPSPLCCIWC